jgi:hypothetical protein
VQIDVLAEAIVRAQEGLLDPRLLTGLLAHERGLLKIRDLPALEAPPIAVE